jgi:hypothetical protein
MYTHFLGYREFADLHLKIELIFQRLKINITNEYIYIYIYIAERHKIRIGLFIVHKCDNCEFVQKLIT